jgi:RNA-directed DNA polymerase
MKRHGNLWGEITSMETLRYAHQQAKRGKGHYSAVKRVEKNVEGHLRQIQEMLRNKTFATGEYQIEDRMEGGKLRRIYKLPYYPDRIVHHALMAVVGPIFRRSMIRDTFQSLPQRGTADARRRVQKMMKDDPQLYALKMDIRKYYPSIPNDEMKKAIRHKIKCQDTLWLSDNIIDSMDGLPIGNLSSQYFGNVYLCWFDWWVKQELNARYYYRYCDDMVLFGKDKAQLREWRKKITGKLEEMGLEIKPDWQIVDVAKQGVDFVGYVFREKQTRLRPAIAHRFRQHAKKSWSFSPKTLLDGLIAYKGWLMRANAKCLWRTHVTNRIVRYCNSVYKLNPIRGGI